MKKNKEGKSVFIFGADGRQARSVIRGFHEAGCRVTAYVRSKLAPGYLTKYSSERIIFDRAKSGGLDFYDYGAKLIREGHYDLVVPLRDRGANWLTLHKEELTPYARIAVNDPDVMQYASDKALTMQVCMEKGIPCPKTVFGENILQKVDEAGFAYPVVIKPRTSGGAMGFHIVRSRDKLKSFLDSYDDSLGPLLCQEYIEQGKSPQYRADFFRDSEGNYKMALVGKMTRWYPPKGGFGVFGFTIHDDKIIEAGKKLLDTIGWNGYANIDMVWDVRENCAKFLEINGRTGASIAMDYAAGINVSEQILQNELGMPVTEHLSYEDNVRISCFFVDVLWFIKSKERFSAKPSWFDRRGIHDTLWSWSDPKPALGYLWHQLTRMKGRSDSSEL